MTTPRPLPLLPTTVVGSYPQPSWLVDRDLMLNRLVPRIRAKDIWRVPEAWLEEAQDDATLLAIRDMERAGVDIITDGEARRESYSNRFATALEGVDPDRPGETLSRTGKPDLVPRFVGPVRRKGPVEVRDVQFLRANTDRTIKITVPGPFTMGQQAVDDYYHDEVALAMALAAALNDEIRDLVAAGVDVVQIDEPYIQARADKAREYAAQAINRALEGVTVPTVLHTCFGYGAKVLNKTEDRYPYFAEFAATNADQVSIEAAQPKLDLRQLDDLPGKTIMLGVLDLADPQVETPDVVAARIRAALQHLEPERLVIAPDCGMKYLPREVAYAKLVAMVQGAKLVRAELGG